jgi:hypothetical protein
MLSCTSSQAAGARRRGGGGVGDCRQDLPVDVDELGRVFGFAQALGDDRHHRFAHVMHALERQHPIERHEIDRAVRALARHRRGKRAQPVRLGIGAGQHGEHARRLGRGGGVDAAAARGGVRRAQHVKRGPPRQADVVGMAAAAAQQLEILGPRHRRPRSNSRKGRALRKKAG